jgi:transketolase
MSAGLKAGAPLDPKTLRRHVLHMAHRGQSVHVPCAFSLIEVLSVLYSKFARFNAADARDPERDRVVLSKGHGVMAAYACFRELGWLEQDRLDRYFSDGSLLRGLSEADIPGLEVTSGSLGHGLPVATGMALGLRRRKRAQRVYCVVGDGELNEGSMWEAIAFAGHSRLDNLTVIVDANGFQAMGTTESILSMEPLAAKFAAFGFEAAECDGHDVAALEKTLIGLHRRTGKPQALIARTVKGKGVSFMEADNTWHYTRISDETMARALKELA